MKDSVLAIKKIMLKNYLKFRRRKRQGTKELDDLEKGSWRRGSPGLQESRVGKGGCQPGGPRDRYRLRDAGRSCWLASALIC